MTTRMRRYLAAAVALGAMATTPPAEALVCVPRDVLVAILDRTYNEQREAIGLTLSDQLIEVFVSETGNWTIILSTPAGTSCFVAAGKAWEARMRPPGPGHEDSAGGRPSKGGGPPHTFPVARYTAWTFRPRATDIIDQTGQTAAPVDTSAPAARPEHRQYGAENGL